MDTEINVPLYPLEDYLTTYHYTTATYGTITINTTAGSNGTYSTYGPWGASGSSINYTTPIGANGSSSGLHVSGNSEFDGDIKVKGRSLTKMLETIESRLAILQEPDPVKLEKFAALKKAYEHYKTLERLIGDDWKDNKNES